MGAIANVRYTHEAIIDEILLDPSVSQGKLAELFGYSQTWMSIIVNSDAFQNRLKERKGELVDPKITASIEDRLNAIANRSLDKLIDRLDSLAPVSTKDLVSIARLGVGDKNTRPAGPPVQNNLYVMQIPAQAKDSEKWLASAHGVPRGSSEIIENATRG